MKNTIILAALLAISMPAFANRDADFDRALGAVDALGFEAGPPPTASVPCAPAFQQGGGSCGETDRIEPPVDPLVTVVGHDEDGNELVGGTESSEQSGGADPDEDAGQDDDQHGPPFDDDHDNGQHGNPNCDHDCSGGNPGNGGPHGGEGNPGQGKGPNG